MSPPPLAVSLGTAAPANLRCLRRSGARGGSAEFAAGAPPHKVTREVPSGFAAEPDRHGAHRA